MGILGNLTCTLIKSPFTGATSLNQTHPYTYIKNPAIDSGFDNYIFMTLKWANTCFFSMLSIIIHLASLIPRPLPAFQHFTRKSWEWHGNEATWGSYIINTVCMHKVKSTIVSNSPSLGDGWNVTYGVLVDYIDKYIINTILFLFPPVSLYLHWYWPAVSSVQHDSWNCDDQECHLIKISVFLILPVSPLWSFTILYSFCPALVAYVPKFFNANEKTGRPGRLCHTKMTYEHYLGRSLKSPPTHPRTFFYSTACTYRQWNDSSITEHMWKN